MKAATGIMLMTMCVMNAMAPPIAKKAIEW
jgi:hypothetical protein